MKKLSIIFASMFFILACTQETDNLVPTNEETTTQVTELTTAEAQIRFAKLLSQAASGSVEVRKFLKAEATRQFDNDYDVFYPMVKDKLVTDGKSFRDILLSYCETPNELAEIEQSQLLLNILIPDLTLFWDFNAEKWDANNEEIVVMCRDDESDTMYENGESIGQIAKGDVPGFPCLVVKNNERLRVKNVNTRSGEAAYEFISDAFDGSKRIEHPATRHSEKDETLEPTEDLSKGIAASELTTNIINAWKEFKDVRGAYQRDYIYYGINKDNQPGVLDRNIREELYRFRIQADAFKPIADQKGSDPELLKPSQKKRYLTKEEILQKIWSDGKFEIYFNSYIASDNSEKAMEHQLCFSIDPRDLFSIEKVHVKHQNSTGFRHSKNTYSVDVANLKSKWYYPAAKGSGNKVFVLPWDLYSKSYTIHLFVEERDDSQKIKTTKNVVNEFVNKADFSIEGGGEVSGIKLNAKLGYGISSTTTITNTIEIETTTDSDNLGTLSFLYNDPIIKSESNGLYNIYSVFNGIVEATLLPKDISK